MTKAFLAAWAAENGSGGELDKTDFHAKVGNDWLDFVYVTV